MTLREAHARAFSQLYASPPLRENALRDAALLLAVALDIPRTALLAHPDRPVTPEQEVAFQALIDRRLTNEPIQYIVGSWEFFGFEILLTPAVLIPRQSTEDLVEAALAELKPEAAASSTPLRIVDIGTGSGIIAIALALHLPNAEITAVDLSTDALEVAAKNAAKNKVADRIRFLPSDLLTGLPPNEPSYDAVISNLPYVPEIDRPHLHAQVRDHEPHLALFGGPDGLDLYRRFLPQARAALKPNGLLGLEMGYRHRDAMVELLADWNNLRIVDDLQQIPRAALARKPTAA
jgi:release factor glutamine methyltransferase